ncbi:MAG: sodium:solute symporter, partial [Bacteroidota bacterium]
LTPPDDEEVLKNFYKKTRPWGFWGPIIAACRSDDPDLKTNQGFARDAFNVTVGIIWQTSLTAAPIFLVIQYWTAFWITLAVAAGLTALLKFSWYDKLQSYPE